MLRTCLLCIILFTALLQTGNAQVLPYARHIVEVLTSDSLKGRGYIDRGDYLAAQFIKNEFEKIGAQPLTDTWFQPFTMQVNTFPDSIFLQLGEQTLTAGSDFLVNPASSPLTGSFETVWLSNEDMFNDARLQEKIIASIGKFLIIEPVPEDSLTPEQKRRWGELQQFLNYHPNNMVAGTVFLTHQKLTWSGSQTQQGRPAFYVVADSVKAPFNQVSVQLTPVLIEDYQTQNVIATLKGTQSDSVIVIMAHYDHFGLMGGALFPGANDNASGVAMMLSLARYFASNPPTYRMVFLAFAGEELGLVGSKYFTEHPTFELNKTKFFFNFDLAGTGDEGIQVVNGSVYPDQFARLQDLNKRFNLLPQVKIRGAACNSDHCMFDRKNLPGFYIYTLGGIRAYHDIYDRYETLPFTEFEDYFELMVRFIESF